MNIRLNGTSTDIDPGITTLAHLLTHLGYDGQTIAVAIDQEFLPRSAYSTTPMTENLDIEIVSPMAGG